MDVGQEEPSPCFSTEFGHRLERPSESRVPVSTMTRPSSAEAADYQPGAFLAAVCLCKEDLRGARPWLAQRFPSFQRRFLIRFWSSRI